MLDMQNMPAPSAGVYNYTAAHIDGRILDRMLRRSSPSQRAVIADDLRTGRLELGPLTARQAQRLAQASQGYINIAGKRREPTPVWFDRLMKRYPTQVMAAIDRGTAPSFSF